MNSLLHELASGEHGNVSPTEITTRIVYLQPSAYSDEALAVGVVFDDSKTVQFEKIGSVGCFETLSDLYGDDFTEQVIFSLELLTDLVSKKEFAITDSNLPVDILRFGPASKAYCENPSSYVRDLLRISSSLFGTYSVRRKSLARVDQATIEKVLLDSIVRLNPLRGKELVQNKKFEITKKRRIEIPLYGNRIMGAPVSLSTTRPGQATNQAEAYIARLHWAREALEELENAIREPVIYVYAPAQDTSEGGSSISEIVNELALIGEASQVSVRVADQIDALARKVYEDESVPIE
jgi:hypothetical protein